MPVEVQPSAREAFTVGTLREAEGGDLIGSKGSVCLSFPKSRPSVVAFATIF